MLKNIHNWWFAVLQKDYKKTGEIDPASAMTPKDPGDIPTFDEWKKKVMEVEKEKSKFRIHWFGLNTDHFLLISDLIWNAAYNFIFLLELHNYWHSVYKSSEQKFPESENTICLHGLL